MPKKKNQEDNENDDEMDIDSENMRQSLSSKQKVYKIFSDIQTSLDKKENLSDFYEIYEDISINEFINYLDNIFGMIFTQYDKNTVPIKNIREFLKKFLEKSVKNSKLKKKNIELINHYCELFTKSAKKSNVKMLCIYFLICFLGPYSSGNVLLYKSNSLDNIKLYLLNILRGKQTFLITLVLQLLAKVPNLLKENEIWERLEVLINGPNKNIKKEIIRLFELNNEDILKYLLKMYDDDSTEIRVFAYEKLSKSKLFYTIEPRHKVRIFYIGLCDTNEKIKDYTKRILKYYLIHLDILKTNKNKDDNKMEVEDSNVSKNEEGDNVIKKEKNDEMDVDEDSINANSTAKEKIQKINSPIQNIGKKLKDSPSRIFDELDVSTYYNHPIYSYVYSLITEHMIELIDKDVIIEYCRNIMFNLKSTVNNSLNELSNTSFEKRRKSWNSQFTSSNIKGVNGFIDKFALFSDLFFYQNILFCLSQQKENEIFKNDVLDLLPDETTYCKIMTNFYLINPNIYILHQLLIVSQYIPYQDEVGNREFINFIHAFISDIDLVNKKITDFQFKRKIAFNQNIENEDGEGEQPNYLDEFNEEKETEILVNNYLLNNNRKIICSMEDLVEYALNILKRIYRGKQNELFREIMQIVSELKDSVEDRQQEVNHSQNTQQIPTQNNQEYKTIKQKENELLEKTKEKLSVIEQIEDDIKRGKGNRIELQMQLNNENKLLEDFDNQMLVLTKQEESTLYRMNILCKFVINNCNKLPFAQFSNMVQQLIVPSLKRVTFPRVVQSALENTGILAIIHYNTVFKNFLKLFFDNIQRDDTSKFSGVIRISLAILLDSCLLNNLLELPENVIGGTVVEKIDMIVDKYLYNQNYDARVLAFMGICKMLLANKFSPPEYLLSRLFVCLYRSYQITDKESEDYNIKISEIMNNFMYFYSMAGKNHIIAIIHAIEIILTSQLYFQNELGFDKNLLCHYSNTKYDFLNKFLYIIFQNAQKKLKHQNYISLVFRIFKYVFFMFKYVKEEDAINQQFEQLQRVRTRKGKQKLKKEEEKENDKKEESKDGEKPEKRKKTIDISINLIRLITNKASVFLDRNDIDQAVFEYYKNNDEFGKLFALMFVMDEIGILPSFSKYFSDRMEEFREKKYIFDINGTTQDYSTEESQTRLREYVKKSEEKYYTLIEGAYNYCLNLKTIKIDDRRDNIKIIEENENDESDGENDGGNSKSSADEVKKEKKNKVDLEDEISEEEEEKSEKNGKKEKDKNKMVEDEKEEEEEDGEDEGEEDEEEESNKNKKKGKNKADSKKKKADELKPRYKKSQTYKNKKNK